MDKSAHAGIASDQPDPTGSRVLLLVKNSIANILRAFSSSAVTVLLPLCLVIAFLPQLYAAWALIFSMGTFVLYFDLGVPTTVQAIVGRAVGMNDYRSAREVTVSGLKVIGAISSACYAAAIVCLFTFGEIFPAMPVAIQSDAKAALVLIVVAQTSTLFGNTVSAYFTGQQRSHLPALILAPARILSMTAALVAAITTSDLVWTAVWYGLPLVLGTGWLIISFLVESNAQRAVSESLQHPAGQIGVIALLKYSGPLMIWGVCMLITTGVGVILVARFDYAAVVPFSIAAIVVSALAGLESSATAPLLPELARTHAIEGILPVSNLTQRLSGLNGMFLFMVSSTLLTVALWFLPFLAKSAHFDLGHSWWILAVLLTGNAIHLTGTPLSLAFIATKTHTRVIFPPVIEAAVNLSVSLWLGMSFGAIGVAIGAVIGAAVGIGLGFSWSLRLAGVLTLSRWQLLSRSTLRPLISTAPMVTTVSLVLLWGTSQTPSGVAFSLLGLIASYVLLWRTALSQDTRLQILRRLATRPRKGEPA